MARTRHGRDVGEILDSTASKTPSLLQSEPLRSRFRAKSTPRTPREAPFPCSRCHLRAWRCRQRPRPPGRRGRRPCTARAAPPPRAASLAARPAPGGRRRPPAASPPRSGGRSPRPSAAACGPSGLWRPRSPAPGARPPPGQRPRLGPQSAAPSAGRRSPPWPELWRRARASPPRPQARRAMKTRPPDTLAPPDARAAALPRRSLERPELPAAVSPPPPGRSGRQHAAACAPQPHRLPKEALDHQSGTNPRCMVKNLSRGWVSAEVCSVLRALRIHQAGAQ